jgi:hypothetical protein
LSDCSWGRANNEIGAVGLTSSLVPLRSQITPLKKYITPNNMSPELMAVEYISFGF